MRQLELDAKVNGFLHRMGFTDRKVPKTDRNLRRAWRKGYIFAARIEKVDTHHNSKVGQ